MLLLLLPFLLACASKGTDTTGETASADMSTFSGIQANVLNLSCAFSTCHGSSSGGLNLSEGTAYSALVGVASTGSPDQTLVVPGDPDSSYLVWKLEGDAGIAGEKMPPGGDIGQDKLDAVRAWITAGAPDN